MSEYASRLYRLIFSIAAAYNIAFGLWASLFPQAFFSLFGLRQPLYPDIWACLGMVIGLYGVGYAYAAWRLDRAFPFIAIGLAGKVLGPIGWVLSVQSGRWPAATFALVVFDDLIWWLPFGLFLLHGTEVSRRVVRAAAYWCAALHAIAAAGTLVLLRGGSEAVSDDGQRVAYLRDHPELWRAGWLLWMVAALSLAGFYVWWGRHIDARPALLAFVLAAIGLLWDFAGQSLYIGLVPAPRSSLYRTASLLSAGAGNLFYTLAGVVLTFATNLGRLRPLAWLVWSSGIALTLAAMAGSGPAITLSSAALMLSFIPFVLLLGSRLS